MNQRFLIRKGYPRLTVLFSGWGGEESLFSSYLPENSDFLVCWDYRDLSFDASMLDGYAQIKVVAWSLGVWVANKVLNGMDLPFAEGIAINGTLNPVNDRLGIPVQVFQGTLENMNDLVLKKFRRRMCGSTENLEAFVSHGLTRSAVELQDELEVLYRSAISDSEPSDFPWTEAFIGVEDKIFPATNQGAAWRGNVLVREWPENHYSELLFRVALEGKVDDR